MSMDGETPYGPRCAVAAWLLANDIDLNDVPINGPIVIERDPLDGRSIRYAALVRSDEGRLVYDRRVDGPKTEERTVPLKAEPLEGMRIDECMPGHTDRQRIIEALRGIAPAHPVTRVWGRFEGATPEQAQEGNAWAADVEDLADIVLRAIGSTEVHRQGP